MFQVVHTSSMTVALHSHDRWRCTHIQYLVLQPVYITYSRGIQTTYASSSSSERSSSPPPSETGEDDHEADPKKSHRRSRKHSKNVPDALEAGSETIEQMKARMEAEWEAEKERLEKEIREEEALKRKEEMSVLGECR